MVKKIKEKLCEETIQLLEKPVLTKDDVEMVGMLVDAIKDVSTAEGMDAYGVKYLDADGSFAVRMPRMSHTSMRSPKYGMGHSGHSVNDRMIASLEHLVDEAETEYERQQIINEIESLKGH